ncbi:MAG: LacI family DNA-binding transcriptional regulator [Opitutaceae bacterium]|jgi:LacI family fructose operon transcriptional repressor|nr:LacI family DNA-binding transcriptional regulator [Opitutaceae bacterium]
MNPGKTPVTLQDIADRTGFGLSTVSLALRRHPSLRQSTGDTIRRAAEEMGYAPNPLVAALMSQVRDKRRARRERLALISRMGETMTKQAHRDTFYPLLYKSIVEHADTRGFGIDEFYMGKDLASDARLSGILVARGIHGVLFFPGNSASGLEYPALDWTRFASVLIGFNTTREGLHQVVSDYVYDIDHALKRIREGRGGDERRIGLSITRLVDRATNQSWTSRFLRYQHEIPEKLRVPLLLADSDKAHRTEVVGWYRKHRPEVILVSGDGARNNLLEAGVRSPRDVHLVNLVQRGEPGLAGIDPHTEEVGHAAVDLLVSLLQTNQRGLATFPRTISLKGHWVPGASFPEAPEKSAMRQ